MNCCKILCVAAAISLFAALPLKSEAAAPIGSAIDQDHAVRLWMSALWRDFKERFVLPDGRVIDDANGDISHSESQGYGMLLAVAMRDRDAFDRIHAFARDKLQVRPDRLFAWRYDPREANPVADLNNASDGDLLIAWALVEAYKVWAEPADLEAARQIIDALQDVVVDTAIGPVLLPGVEGFRSDEVDGKLVLNPSYWIFPAFEVLSEVDETIDWAGLAKSGDVLLTMSQFGPHYLTSDWIELSQGTTVPAPEFDPEFSYNSIRIPLYLAFSRQPLRQRRAADYAAAEPFAVESGPYVVDVTNGILGGRMGGAGFRAIASLTHCLDRGSTMPAETVKINQDPYYPTTLQLLVFVLVIERYPQCLSLDY